MKKSELGYVRKRKRRRIVAITSATATAAIGVFVLVAFLGRFVGTFTVSLDTGSVKLSLSDSANDSTSYIQLNSLPAFDLESYTNLPSASELDNEDTTIDLGTVSDSKGNTSMKFFKYTFFVKNEGTISADYDFKVNITRDTPSEDNRHLSEILRVLVYENYVDSDEHNYRIFAKKSETINKTYGYEDGDETYKEYISYDNPDKAEARGFEFPGFAEMFESDSVVATLPTKNFQEGDVKRYTIVAWLEGEDQQANGNPPEGGNLKLGVTINAYENQ